MAWIYKWSLYQAVSQVTKLYLKRSMKSFKVKSRTKNYKGDNVSITTSITGKKSIIIIWSSILWSLWKGSLASVLDKYKKSLGEKFGIIELIDNWDSLPNPKSDGLSKYIDVIGCFLFPKTSLWYEDMPWSKLQTFFGKIGKTWWTY